MDLIYLDHNATTPLDPEAFEAMRPWFTESFGNASSAYALGHLSDGAVVAARGVGLGRAVEPQPTPALAVEGVAATGKAWSI